MDFDTSVSVGDALNGYGYFSETKWTSFEDSQKRQTVEFEGTFDMEKFVGSEFQGLKVTAKKFEEVNKKMPKDMKWSRLTILKPHILYIKYLNHNDRLLR